MLIKTAGLGRKLGIPREVRKGRSGWGRGAMEGEDWEMQQETLEKEPRRTQMDLREFTKSMATAWGEKTGGPKTSQPALLRAFTTWYFSPGTVGKRHVF